MAKKKKKAKVKRKVKVKRKAKVKRRALPKRKAIAKAPAAGTPEMAREPVPNKGGHPGKAKFEPPETGDSFHYKRFAAGMYYTTDLQGVTIEQLNRHPMFRDVSFHTLRHWCVEDKWADRRKANLAKWQRAIESKIGTELLKARSKDLVELRGIYNRMITKLKGRALKAKSYEGMVNALTKLADLMDAWSEKISANFVPDVPLESGSVSLGLMAHETRPKLTTQEARAAAKAVLTQRRQETRLRQAQQETVDAGEERPKLQVLEGEK